MAVEETTQVATYVTRQIAERLRELADEHERSVAAEVRLALRHWIDAQDKKAAA